MDWMEEIRYKNDDLQWNRKGETAGVIDIERIAIGKYERRGKTWIGMEIVEKVFFFEGLNV